MKSTIPMLLMLSAMPLFADYGSFEVQPFQQFCIPGSGGCDSTVDHPNDEKEWVYLSVQSLESWAYITVMDPDSNELLMSPQMALDHSNYCIRYVRNNDPTKDLALTNWSNKTILVFFDSSLNVPATHFWNFSTAPVTIRKTSSTKDSDLTESIRSKKCTPLKLQIPDRKEDFIPDHSPNSPMILDGNSPFKREFKAFRRKKSAAASSSIY